MNKEKNFISAVVYVRNAEHTIGGYLEHLSALLAANFEHAEIICVNDASTDSSAAVIKAASANAKGVAMTLLNMSYFHGVELAMNAGVDLAIGDFVLEVDTPVQDYDIGEIMNVYHHVLSGYDIVSACADKPARLSSRLFYWLYARFTDEHIKMRSETFRILSRRAINRVGAMSRVSPYRKSLYANCGLKTDHLLYTPLSVSAKHGGDGEYRRELAVDSLIMFTDAGYFFAKTMTYVMMLLSLFMIVYTIVIYASANPVAGWTTTILFMAVSFCGLFGILTIIVKYLQILLNLVFKRQKYTFESIEKLTK